MQKDQLRFDELRWREYLENFNAIEKWSQIDKFSLYLDLDSQRTEILSLTKQIRNNNNYSLPQDTQASPLMRNLKLIYGGSYGDNWGNVKAYRDIREKIVEEYVCIQGMEQLFDQVYYQFEWNMHVTPDFVKGKESLYRDHFLHQAKNAWMGYEFMQKLDWMRYCVKWLTSPENKKIAQYVNNAVENEMARARIADSQTAEKPLYKLIRIYVEAIDASSSCGGGAPQNFLEGLLGEKINWNSIPSNTEKETIVLRAYVRFNLIETTWFIAALLHDIGYPLSHFHRSLHQISQFIPSMEWHDPTDERSFDQFRRRLKNSLLFRVVHESTLEKEFRNNVHGTLSALMMLNHFYEQGTVHTFTPLQQCAVDWAAVCIQQHTQKFRFSTLDEDDENGIDLVSNNPLGYLLRLVDDLQEYGRFYFQIDGCHTLLFCPKCGYVLRSKSADLEEYDGHLRSEKEMILSEMQIFSRKRMCNPVSNDELLVHSSYNHEKRTHWFRCACMTDDPKQAIEQCKTFDTRRINIIRFCDQATIDVDEVPRTGILGPDGKVRVKLHYDPWAMLELSRMNPRFLQGRIAPNNEIKRMLQNQSQLPRYILYYTITPNPIWLKARILYDYIRCNHESVWREVCELFWQAAIGVLNDESISRNLLTLEPSELTKTRVRQQFENRKEASCFDDKNWYIKAISTNSADIAGAHAGNRFRRNDIWPKLISQVQLKLINLCDEIIRETISPIQVPKNFPKDIAPIMAQGFSMKPKIDLCKERAIRTAISLHEIYVPILGLYAFEHFRLDTKRSKEEHHIEPPDHERLLLEAERELSQWYKSAVRSFEGKSNIPVYDNSGMSSPKQATRNVNDEVCFFMRHILEYLSDMEYSLSGEYNLFERENQFIQSEKAYSRSYENITRPTLPLSRDQRGSAYREQLLQKVESYTDINSYEPTRLHQLDSKTRHHFTYVRFGFYDDLSFFKKLYEVVNQERLRKDGK